LEKREIISRKKGGRWDTSLGVLDKPGEIKRLSGGRLHEDQEVWKGQSLDSAVPRLEMGKEGTISLRTRVWPSTSRAPVKRGKKETRRCANT